MIDSTALRLIGSDALALLHRIGTNVVADLLPGSARATLFCDFRGRLLHRVAVGVAADGSVWLLRDDAPGAGLAAFLDRHVFRDDVHIEDRSSELPVHWIPDAREIDDGLAERDGVPTTWRVGRETLTLGAVDASAGELVRIRAGRPRQGHEIAEAFNPFEVGLAHEVHLDKGCYTGQEALMRLITYQSVKRRLVRMGGSGDAPQVPAELTADGAPAGVLTSAASHGAHWIGLGVVRNELCAPPRALEVAGGGITDVIEPLPPTRPLGRG
jgi:hypothetical protein